MIFGNVVKYAYNWRIAGCCIDLCYFAGAIAVWQWGTAVMRACPHCNDFVSTLQN